MKNYLIHVFKHKILLIVILVSSFLFGFTLASTINNYTSTYTVSFSCSSDSAISFEEMLTKEYLNKIKIKCNGKNDYYDGIDTNKMSLEKGIRVEKLLDENYILETKTSYYPDFFLKSSESVSTRAKTFLKTLLNTYAEEKNYTISIENKNIIEKNSPISTPWVYGISTISLVGLTGLYLVSEFFVLKKHNDEEEVPYDNKNTFATPFHKDYWKNVFTVFKDIRKISGIAMMLALMILAKFISLPSGFGNLGLSFTFIIFAIASMIYGPFAGFILGTFSDIIGYFIFQTAYAFFFGYTLQAALCGVIYGLLLYKTKVTYQRAFIARFIVNIFMNVIFGSICWGIVSNYTVEQTFFYALVFELPKNLIYLVPQSLVLFIIIKALSPALARLRLISKNQYKYYRKKEPVE